ncbi:MAG TPA: hypothetical protein VK797_17245 [Tepidisphaeraceae bacterium]|jgi:hypothetical protein|nr:hypothetical protein [Tepidisphaeraceae bacterium]
MPTTLGIRRRRLRAKLGIGMPGDNSHILAVARRLRDRVDAAVLGGIAVYLHGGGRSTVDLDLYTTDRTAAAKQLEDAGARWDKAKREHVLTASASTPSRPKTLASRSPEPPSSTASASSPSKTWWRSSSCPA